MPNQLLEAYEDLKALSHAHQLMDGDPTITEALDLAEQRMLVAASNYLAIAQGRPANGQQVRSAHRSPGVGDDRQKPYSRADVRPPAGGVSRSAVALPIAPLNTAPPAPPIQRLPAAGHVQTAPGLPDAVVPQGAQLHPRTMRRIQAAQGAVQAVADDAVQLPAPDPTATGDLPGIPIMDPPAPYPGAPPPTQQGGTPTR